jgi:hypothetical protein
LKHVIEDGSVQKECPFPKGAQNIFPFSWRWSVLLLLILDFESKIFKKEIALNFYSW